MESRINWIQKTFAELNTTELYALLRLRTEVFVVEQNCVFQDMDNKDQKSHHLMGWVGDDLVAYARILPAFHTMSLLLAVLFLTHIIEVKELEGN